MNWLLGLPCWLAGCQLADYISARGKPRPVRFIWLIRLAVWAAMSGCMVLRYHTPLGYPWTLDIFALFVAVWLGFEIVNFMARPPSPKLEWLGLWSYSLYLTHKLALIVYGWLKVPDLTPWPNWAVRLMFILAFAYLFYRLVEKPAHCLARIVARQAAGLVAARAH